MTPALAARFRDSVARLLTPPPTPIPSPPGGWEALHARPPAPPATAQRRHPLLWERDGKGGQRLGLAVSGGGDSMAMLHLAVEAGFSVAVVTVDHGLRPEAADEASWVGQICQGLAVPHQTLRWHWDGKGNLQDAARRARRRLIADWAGDRGLAAVALAHSQDDLAETFLMRLARGAGVDGLSAMAPVWSEAGMLWLRPLLDQPRAALREYLQGRGLAWVEDPSNANTRFDRVKARQALTALAPLGLTPPRLADVSRHLAEARDALQAATAAAWARLVTDRGLALHLDGAGLVKEPPEIARRLLVRATLHLAPAAYAPRGPDITRLLGRLAQGQDATLAGCRFQHLKSGLWACREARAAAPAASMGDTWDGRWRIDGPWPPGAELRALGTAGLALCPDWRALGLPRAALLAAPALWLGDRLIAAPHLGLGLANFRLSPPMTAAAVHHSVISH